MNIRNKGSPVVKIVHTFSQQTSRTLAGIKQHIKHKTRCQYSTSLQYFNAHQQTVDRLQYSQLHPIKHAMNNSH